MNNPILFDDLADMSGILKALDRIEAANKKLADGAVTQNARIKASHAELIETLTQQREEVAKFNEKQKEAGKAARALADEVAKTAKALRDHNSMLERNKQLLDTSTASVTAMKARLRDLKTEYDGLDRSEAKNLQRQKEIAREMRAMTTVVKSLTSATQTATKAIVVAERSYAALDNQTKKLKADLRQMADAFDPVTGKINQHNRAAVEMQKRIEINDKALKNMDAQMGNYQRNVGNYGSALQGFAGQITGITSVAAGAMLALSAIEMGVGIAQDMERYDAMLKAVSRDSADFSRSQQFLLTLADRLGLQYGDLVDSYKGLKAATKDTVLEGKQTEHMFSAVATAGAKLRLTNETVTGTLLALTQMISKGHIQAEELRGQLGERLPGALKLMAEALGVSEVKLNTMMEQGQLIATEVMPRFADSLDKAYGLKQNEKIESLSASTNRLKNETALLIAEFNKNKAVTGFFGGIANAIAGLLGDMRRAVKDGAWKDFFSYLNPLTTTTAQFIGVKKRYVQKESDREVGDFSNMDTAGRKKRIQQLMNEENEEYKTGSVKRAEQLADIRRRLNRQNIKLELAERRDADRQELLAKKSGIEKNETDLARFQKQAVRKRTAEILALEKQVAADSSNVAAAEKLRVYTKLDAEQKAKDKAVSTRLKQDKPAKIDDSTPLELIDKQIKSIEKTLQSQAMQDLKAGRVIDVDPKLTAKVFELKKQYEALKTLQKDIEAGWYTEKIKIDAAPLTSISTLTTGKTGRVGRDKTANLTAAQIKEEEDKITKVRVGSLNEQVGIMKAFDFARRRLEYDFKNDLQGLTKDRKDNLLGLLTEIEAAERKGDRDEVQRLKEKYRQMAEEDKDYLGRKKALQEKAVEIGVTLVNGLFEIEQAKNQQRITNLEKSKEYELAAVGDNAEAKQAIETKYDNKRKEIQRQQDRAAQQQALFNIAVSTAVAAVNAYKAGPAGLPLAIAIGILGAVQAGIVLARPLPQYKDGKNVDGGDAYAGPALVGEAGRELWVHNGTAELVDKPSILDVGRNDTIYPNAITEKLLRGDYSEGSAIMQRNRLSAQTSQRLTSQRDQYQSALLASALLHSGPSADAIGRAVGKHTNWPKQTTVFDQRGVTNYVTTANGNKTRQRGKHQFGG